MVAMEITTQSYEETQKAGSNFVRKLKGGEIIALVGEMGAGKTTFVQGLALGLGIKRRITSPTFIIMRRYDIKLKTQSSKVKTTAQNSKVKSLYHLDLYRLEHEIEKEVKNLGLTDVWGKRENIVVIEWAEKIKNWLPKSTIWVNFDVVGSKERTISYMI